MREARAKADHRFVRVDQLNDGTLDSIDVHENHLALSIDYLTEMSHRILCKV